MNGRGAAWGEKRQERGEGEGMLGGMGDSFHMACAALEVMAFSPGQGARAVGALSPFAKRLWV